jgi:hypothetical protein
VDTIERACGRNPLNPPAGVGHIVHVAARGRREDPTLTPHMHLLGRGMSIVLDPGTPKRKTLLDVTNFSFDHQRSYPDGRAGDSHRGGHAPRQLHLQPRSAPAAARARATGPSLVTLGDGSSDEICLAIVGWVS